MEIVPSLNVTLSPTGRSNGWPSRSADSTIHVPWIAASSDGGSWSPGAINRPADTASRTRTDIEGAPAGGEGRIGVIVRRGGGGVNRWEGAERKGAEETRKESCLLGALAVRSWIQAEPAR